jgi:uncharacterized protein YuzE
VIVRYTISRSAQPDSTDVLYISVGDPRPAVTIDAGESMLLRFDEGAGEIVGITIMNVRRRLLEGLAGKGAAEEWWDYALADERGEAASPRNTRMA